MSKMSSHGVLIVCCLCLIWFGKSGQLNWTPTHHGGNSTTHQIDMWTKDSNGCECEFEPSRKDCACCVKPGGCPCGISAPNRCAQCGLHQHCNNMCNLTISQKSVFSESKSTVGQIKSPSLQGPAVCWYLLKAEPGHRLEIQIYRLVNVGRFNGTGCQSGYVHLIDETDVKTGSNGVQICGENERFSPPVVIFADKETATLTFRIDETTTRSQFLAHYSFTLFNNTQGVGFRPNGGKRIEHTSCDWLYQDFTCINESEGCILASPGYPGLYPSNSTCRYHITMSSLRTKVKIIFVSLSLPLNRCATDYINVYQGPSSSSSLLKTLCLNKKQELIYSGPNILLEFKSGISLPPYDYNGFVARLEFVDRPTTTESSLYAMHPAKTSSRNSAYFGKTTSKADVSPLESQPTAVASSKADQFAEKNCVLRIFGNSSRSGHFDMRTLPANCTHCTVILLGQSTDLIHISLFNYRLDASSCQSFIEIVDGDIQTRIFKSLKKICSPKTKYAHNADGRFHEQQTFLSHSNTLSVYFRRTIFTQHKSDSEYVDGAYSFMDEYAEGTIQPDTLCDVTYYGLTSSSLGRIQNHGAQHLFWNVEGSLRCSQRFIPTTSQSVALKLNSLRKLSSSTCQTMCGDSGCQCSSSYVSQDDAPNAAPQYDHLLILDEHNTTLSCICGSFREEWLPIIIRSWTPLSVVYSLAKYSWAEKGFSFEAEYKFEYDNICGHRKITDHSGILQSVYLAEAKELNYYYNQVCTWTLDSKIERQLLIEIESQQNRPCSAWNISLYEHNPDISQGPDSFLSTFCSRDKTKSFELPWKLNIIVIKLFAMTRTLPQFKIKWRSQVVQTHTKLSVLTPEASNAASRLVFHIVTVCSHLLFSYFFRSGFQSFSI